MIDAGRCKCGAPSGAYPICPWCARIHVRRRLVDAGRAITAALQEQREADLVRLAVDEALRRNRVVPQMFDVCRLVAMQRQRQVRGLS